MDLHTLTASLFAAPFLLCGSSMAAEQPLMTRVSERVSKLASTSGFSDEDAVAAATFILEQLNGPKPEGQKLSSRVVISEPEKIRVFVAYDFGVGFHGYEIEFRRGDPKSGMRWAHFVSLTLIPSE
jgi:hypothetical protein